LSIPETEWGAAVAAFEQADRVALACHVGPDGDALGSMLALGLALRARGVQVTASWGSKPFSPPRQYDFLAGLDLLVPPEQVDEAPPLMATFDAGSLDRIGSLEPNARAAGALVVVDHHASNDHFGTVNLIDPESAASAVLVHELLGRLGAKLDRDIATCLYVGLVTDTGQFKYRNTTPSVHQVAADLLSHGVPQDDIGRIIYDTHPVGYLRLASVVLDRLTHRPEAKMVWSWFSQQDLVKAGCEMEDTDAMIDLIRTADVADVAALVKQHDDGAWKVSMRSKGSTDVGAFCSAQGGGGHALAAGYTSDQQDPAVIAEQIVTALRR